MKQVVATNGQRVTVAGDNPHRQVGPGDRQTCRDGRCPAVDGVHPVGLQVVGEAGGAADTRDEGDVLPGYPEFGQEALDGGQDGVVPAAGAPADLLVGGEVLTGLRPVGDRDEIEQSVADAGVVRRDGHWLITSSKTPASSAALNGSPRTWL